MLRHRQRQRLEKRDGRPAILSKDQAQGKEQVVAEGEERGAQDRRQGKVVGGIVQKTQERQHIPYFLAIKIAAAGDGQEGNAAGLENVLIDADMRHRLKEDRYIAVFNFAPLTCLFVVDRPLFLLPGFDLIDNFMRLPAAHVAGVAIAAVPVQQQKLQRWFPWRLRTKGLHRLAKTYFEFRRRAVFIPRQHNFKQFVE